MKKFSVIVLCSALAAATLAFGGCPGGKDDEDTQIKQLVTETPTPTVQPEADNPENTQTTEGISMTNDYLNQKEAGQVPSIKDNESVSSGNSENDGAASGESSQDSGKDNTSSEDGSGDTQDDNVQDNASQDESDEE